MNKLGTIIRNSKRKLCLSIVCMTLVSLLNGCSVCGDVQVPALLALIAMNIKYDDKITYVDYTENVTYLFFPIKVRRATLHSEKYDEDFEVEIEKKWFYLIPYGIRYIDSYYWFFMQNDAQEFAMSLLPDSDTFVKDEVFCDVSSNKSCNYKADGMTTFAEYLEGDIQFNVRFYTESEFDEEVIEDIVERLNQYLDYDIYVRLYTVDNLDDYLNGFDDARHQYRWIYRASDCTRYILSN